MNERAGQYISHVARTRLLPALVNRRLKNANKRGADTPPARPGRAQDTRRRPTDGSDDERAETEAR